MLVLHEILVHQLVAALNLCLHQVWVWAA
jgi:hypothetical protein